MHALLIILAIYGGIALSVMLGYQARTFLDAGASGFMFRGLGDYVKGLGSSLNAFGIGVFWLPVGLIAGIRAIVLHFKH